jgi:hypothetical protein
MRHPRIPVVLLTALVVATATRRRAPVEASR